MKRTASLCILSVAICLGAGPGTVRAQLDDDELGGAEQPAAGAKPAKDAKGKRVKQAKQEGAAATRQGPARFKLPEPELRKTAMDTLAQKKREEAIERLKGLIPKYSGPEKAEFIFRLAELYWESQKFFYLKAMQQWDATLQAWYEAGSKGDQPQIDDRESEVYKQQALGLYQTILDKYPEYPRKDEVLYVMAFNMYESGKKDDAIKLYLTLIKQYPESKYVADSYLQMGDHFFNKNQLPPAVKAYTKALQTNKPKVYSYALYKLAWCDFNLQEYGGALDKMKKVVDYSEKQKGVAEDEGQLGEKDRIQLREEALSDMTMVYSRLDDYEDALKYFNTKTDPDTTYKYMAKLAALFGDQGKWDLQIRSLKLVNDTYPYHPRAPANQSDIVKAYAALEKPDMVRKEVRRLIDLYRPTAPWAQRNADNPSALEQAYDLTETALRELVTEYHREAQKFKSIATYTLARDIYKEYLDYFAESPFAYRMRFFYAEILYALKEFDNAAVQYDVVVDGKKDGKFAKIAAYNAILCYEKLVEGVNEKASGTIDEKAAKGTLRKLERLDRLSKGKAYDPTEITPYEQKLANAYDRFVDVAPDDDEVVKVKFKSARIYYIHNRFVDAAERFGEIIDRWPQHELGRSGAELILESFNTREDWPELRKWSAKFAANDRLMKDAKFRGVVADYLEGSTFKDIQTNVEPSAAPLVVAEAYLGFVKDFPKSKFAMVSLYNSVVFFDKANFLDRAIDASKRLLKEFATYTQSAEDAKEAAGLPKPDQIRELATFGLASLYERIASFQASAKQYEEYGKAFATAKRAPDAWYNAGLYRQGLGELKPAIAAFEEYLKAAPAAADAAAVYWRIGLLYEKLADWRKMHDHFESFDRKYGKQAGPRIVLARAKAATALLKQNNKRDALRLYDEIVKLYPKLPAEQAKSPEALQAYAQARFDQIEDRFIEYIALRLELPQWKLEKNLTTMLTSLTKLEADYAAVLAIGEGGYGVASLFRIGRLYQHLAKAMMDAPLPPSLTEDQKMIYQAALQEKAFPLEEKAIEAYEKALAKSFELGIYSDWAVKTQQALADYDPSRFPAQRVFDLVAAEPASALAALAPADDVPHAELVPRPAPVAPAGGPGTAGQPAAAQPAAAPAEPAPAPAQPAAPQEAPTVESAAEEG